MSRLSEVTISKIAGVPLIPAKATPKRVRPSRAAGAVNSAKAIAAAKTDAEKSDKAIKPLVPASQQADKEKGFTLATPKKTEAQDKPAARFVKGQHITEKIAKVKKVSVEVPAPTKVRKERKAELTGRMSPNDRTEQLLYAAVKAAMKMGYKAVTREAVATEAKVSSTLPTRYFGSMDGLRDAIVKSAVEKGCIKLIAEALVHKHPAARKVKAQYKEAVVKYLFD